MKTIKRKNRAFKGKLKFNCKGSIALTYLWYQGSDSLLTLIDNAFILNNFRMEQLLAKRNIHFTKLSKAL